MPRERGERGIPKSFRRAAVAAPFLILAAHFGACNTAGGQKEPTTAPSQASGQQLNPDAVPTKPGEQLTQNNPPTEPTVNPATRVPTLTSPSENPTPELDSLGQLIFSEPGYQDYRPSETHQDYRLSEGYSLYKNMDLDKLLGKISTDFPNGWDILQFLKEKGYVRPEAIGGIQNLLRKAQQKELVDPKDPAIIKYVNSAADILNMNCNANSFAKSYMQRLASFAYLQDPDAWPTNKRFYIDGKCYWGEKTTTSSQYQVIHLENGIFLYDGVTYDDLLSEKNLAPLRAVLTQPQTLDENVIQPLRNAQRFDAQNPNDPQIDLNLFVVVDRLQDICKSKPQGKEYMRLVTSLVLEKDPKGFKYFTDNSMVSCLMDTQN